MMHIERWCPVCEDYTVVCPDKPKDTCARCGHEWDDTPKWTPWVTHDPKEE